MTNKAVQRSAQNRICLKISVFSVCSRVYRGTHRADLFTKWRSKQEVTEVVSLVI